MSTVIPITSATASYAATALQPALVSNTDDSGGAAGSNTHIDAVAKDFEAVFLSQMMEAMFDGDDLKAFFGGGTEGEVYKSYLLNEYGKAMAQNGGIGIAAQVKQELLKMQEIAA